MTLKHLIERATEGKEGVAGAWRIERVYIHGARVARLYHYSTLMLQWDIDFPHGSDKLDWSLGWGSVSDQQGMNVAFRELGLPYYYSRRQGAKILSLHDRGDRAQLPKHIRDYPAIHLGTERAECFTP